MLSYSYPGVSDDLTVIPRHISGGLVADELGQVFGIVGFEAAYAHGEDWLDELLPYLEANVDLMEKFLDERAANAL